MKTIGQLLKDARDNKSLSLGRLEEITKIKASFIDSIEKEKWDALPSFPTILGFVKSLAGALLMDEKMLVAILKRDYPPQKLKINPTPDISSKFVWSPKLTFSIGIGIVLVLIISYLTFQYVRFVSPPTLDVQSPKDGQTVVGRTVLVFGETDIDAKITVNNQPALVDEDGKFSISLNISPETNEVVIKSISRSGKESEVKRKIQTAQ